MLPVDNLVSDCYCETKLPIIEVTHATKTDTALGFSALDFAFDLKC